MFLRIGRLALFVFGVLVAILILGLSIVHTTQARSFDGGKRELALSQTVATLSPTPSVSPSPANSYYLPYPGILPDHFLYRVKMGRDFIKQLLTRGPDKKAKLFLFYADKRVNAAGFLIAGGKVRLGVMTAGKAERYLVKAYEQGLAAEAQGKKMEEFWVELHNASTKHEDLLSQLEEEMNEPQYKVDMLKTIEQAKMIKDKAGEKILSQE